MQFNISAGRYYITSCAENWFGRLEDLIGSSVAVIGDYEARERVEMRSSGARECKARQ